MNVFRKGIRNGLGQRFHEPKSFYTKILLSIGFRVMGSGLGKFLSIYSTLKPSGIGTANLTRKFVDLTVGFLKGCLIWKLLREKRENSEGIVKITSIY